MAVKVDELNHLNPGHLSHLYNVDFATEYDDSETILRVKSQYCEQLKDMQYHAMLEKMNHRLISKTIK